MKIYLASGFTLINAPGREEAVCKRFTVDYGHWRRLMSFHFFESDWKKHFLPFLIKEINCENKQK